MENTITVTDGKSTYQATLCYEDSIGWIWHRDSTFNRLYNLVEGTDLDYLRDVGQHLIEYATLIHALGEHTLPFNVPKAGTKAPDALLKGLRALMQQKRVLVEGLYKGLNDLLETPVDPDTAPVELLTDTQKNG